MRKIVKKSKRKATRQQRSLTAEVEHLALFLRKKVHTTEEKKRRPQAGLSPAHTVEQVAKLMRTALKSKKPSPLDRQTRRSAPSKKRRVR